MDGRAVDTVRQKLRGACADSFAADDAGPAAAERAVCLPIVLRGAEPVSNVSHPSRLRLLALLVVAGISPSNRRLAAVGFRERSPYTSLPTRAIYNSTR